MFLCKVTNFQKGVDKSVKVWYNDYSEREKHAVVQVAHKNIKIVENVLLDFCIVI